MHGHLGSQTEYREVGGELVCGTIADSRTTHVEVQVLARRATGPSPGVSVNRGLRCSGFAAASKSCIWNLTGAASTPRGPDL